MKKSLVLIVGMVLIGLSFTPAYADLTGSAVASVFVNVNPNIALTPKTPTVDAGTVQMGDFSATIVYTVGANLEKVSLFLEASGLFKGDDPLNADVAPIALNISKPAEITAQFGHRINSLPDTAIWGPAGLPIGAYPTFKTETVTYESSQRGHFSQDLSCKLWYKQPDPEKPVGNYSGKVRLTAFITP